MPKLPGNGAAFPCAPGPVSSGDAPVDARFEFNSALRSTMKARLPAPDRLPFFGVNTSSDGYMNTTRSHDMSGTKGRRGGRGTAAATPPRIVILSLPRAHSYEPHGCEVCISITDPKAAPARVSPAFRSVLRVSFTDIIEPTGLDWHVLFTPEHAEKILDFVDRWSNVEAIVIHCVGGLSRSPAVGMALCELHGWPLGAMETDYPIWNKWVRSELVRRGRERRKRATLRAKPANTPGKRS